MDRERAAVGRLFVCPTPIGNLGDITLRALEVLRHAEVIACEDTRRTRILLEHHRLGLEQRELISLHEHNEGARARQLLAELKGGAVVALVSDAGMPVISDPGFLLVRAAIDAGVPIEVLPGPSAAIVALVASGLPPSPFRFVGFLPRSRNEIERLVARLDETLVAFESPRRLSRTLELLAGVDPHRRAAVCRELTKLHEDVIRGTASELASHFAGSPPRGEVVLVVGAAARAAVDWRPALAAFAALAESGAPPRPAARAVAALVGVSANELYERAMGRGGQACPCSQ